MKRAWSWLGTGFGDSSIEDCCLSREKGVNGSYAGSHSHSGFEVEATKTATYRGDREPADLFPYRHGF